MFTTVHDDQQELCILVLEGGSQVASQNRVLGQFDLVGLPPGPAGSTRIEVTFTIDGDNTLSVNARDMDGARHGEWLRDGGMIARLHVNDSEEVFTPTNRALNY